jgi:hypothetical protein
MRLPRLISRAASRAGYEAPSMDMSEGPVRAVRLRQSLASRRQL